MGALGRRLLQGWHARAGPPACCLATQAHRLPTACAWPQARAMLFTLPTALQVLWRVEAVEGAVAAALWVPTAPTQPAAADSTAAEAKCGSDLESGGDGPAAEAAADGAAQAEGGAAAGEPQPARPRGLTANPYLRNAATLLALISSVAAWASIIKAAAEACRGLPAALSSRKSLAAGELPLRALGRREPPCAAPGAASATRCADRLFVEPRSVVMHTFGASPPGHPRLQRCAAPPTSLQSSSGWACR